MQPKPLTADELRRQAATGEMPRWMLVKNPERTIELLNIEDVRPLTREEELELEQLLGDRVEERPAKEKAQSVQAVMAQIAAMVAGDKVTPPSSTHNECRGPQRKRLTTPGPRASGVVGLAATGMVSGDERDTSASLQPRLAHPAPRVDIQWERAHAMGIEASAIIAHRRGGQYDANIDKVIEQVDQVKKDGEDLARFLCDAPPSVLHLLDRAGNVAHRLPDDLKIGVAAALRLLYGDDEVAGQQASVQFGRVMAFNLLYGTAPARVFLRLCWSFIRDKSLRRRWKELLDNDELTCQLDDYLDVLRSDEVLCSERVTALTKMSDWLWDLPWWAQVRNAVYQQLFCWPLLVRRANSGNCGEIVAFSIPVLVEVEYDNNGSGACRVEWGDEEYDQDVDETVDSVNQEEREKSRVQVRRMWKRHLQKAVDVGKELWRREHRHFGRLSCDTVNRAIVTFDFRVARQMVQDISLADGSAESYFAQVVLNRLLRRPSVISSVATGHVVRYVTYDDEVSAPPHVPPKWKHLIEWREGKRPALAWHGVWTGADFNRAKKELLALNENNPIHRAAILAVFSRPGERKTVAAKMKPMSARGSHGKKSTRSKIELELDGYYSERMVLAKNARKCIRAVYRRRRPLRRWPTEMLAAQSVAEMADIMQTGGWRRRWYVRCPDLRWGFETRHPVDQPGLLPVDDEDVCQVMEELKQSWAAVTTIDRSPQSVLSALVHIDVERKRHRSRSPLSWACIHASKDLLSEPLWQIVFRCTGAPTEVFEAFRFSQTDGAARILAAILNQLKPSDPSRAWRAPDVLVIVGADSLQENTNEEHRHSWPLIAQWVFEALNRQEVAAVPGMEAWLGKTRVILVSNNDRVPMEDVGSLNHASPRDNLIISMLSGFEWGFTQQMACLVLKGMQEFRPDFSDLASDDLRQTLRELARRKKLLCYGQGEYFLPSEVRSEIREPVSGEHYDANEFVARRHYLTGVALAPYTSRRAVPALSFDTAFLPENIHEARYHFAEAFKLAQEKSWFVGKYRKRRLENEAMEGMAHIDRFVLMPSWRVLIGNVKGRKDPKFTWEQGTELLELYRQRQGSCHPSHAANVLKAGIDRWRTLPQDSDDAVQLRTELGQLYEQARFWCNDEKWASDTTRSALRLVSMWATFLMQHDPGQVKEIASLNEEVWRLLDETGNASYLWGEWCEVLADQTEDDCRAAEICWRGIQAGVPWNQLWVKGVGAEIIGRCANKPIQEALVSVGETPTEIALIVKKAGLGLKRLQRGKLVTPSVLARWQAAYRFFNSRWGNHREVAMHLRAYRVLRDLR